MARKPLLTESEIRSFMKLAELRPLGQEKVQQMVGTPVQEEDELERELDATEDELGREDDVADEEADELGDLGDMDMDMDVGAYAGAPGMVSVDDFMGALEAALEDVLGEPVSTEMDDDMAADDDMEDADAMDMHAEMETDMALDAEEEEELPGMRDMYEDQEALVNEVAKRVAARLAVNDSKEKMVDALAERIMTRLTNNYLTFCLRAVIITIGEPVLFFQDRHERLVATYFGIYFWIRDVQDVFFLKYCEYFIKNIEIKSGYLLITGNEGSRTVCSIGVHDEIDFR